MSDELKPLTVRDGLPITESGRVGCVMMHSTGVDGDDFWFRYKTTFFNDPITLRWDKDAAYVLLESDLVHYLFNNGYARAMTAVEVEDYNEQLNHKETTS